jgi:hypothetical protein
VAGSAMRATSTCLPGLLLTTVRVSPTVNSCVLAASDRDSSTGLGVHDGDGVAVLQTCLVGRSHPDHGGEHGCGAFGADPEVGVSGRAGADQLFGDQPGLADRIAKPTPMVALCEEELPEESSEAMAELMPSSWPLALTRAPQLLPRLIAALVYIVLETTGRRSAGWTGW